ncbi:hypothetical protein [Kaarinaea lacus]
MRYKVAAIIVSLFFLPTIALCDNHLDQQNESVNSNDNTYWVDLFLIGLGGISDGASLAGYGLRVRKHLKGSYFLTAMIHRSQEFCHLGGCAVDTQEQRIDVKITELNVGIGYSKRYGIFNLSTSAGLGYLRGTAAVSCDEFATEGLFADDICEEKTLDNVALPIDISLLWGRSMALGMNFHFNFNSVKRFGLTSFVWAF